MVREKSDGSFAKVPACTPRLGPWLGWPAAHARIPRGPYWAAGPDPVTAGLFNSKTTRNLASKQTCKFNIKFCRNPKIVKLILLGS